MSKRAILVTLVALPVLLLVTPVLAQGGLSSYRLPQIANGTGIQTTFILFNNTDSQAFIFINLTKADGLPWDLSITGLPPGSTKQLTLPAGQTRFLKTSGTGTVTVGAATVQSLAPIGVSAIFSIFNGSTLLTEAGIGASEEVTEAQIPVDTSAGFNTGMAILNTSFVPNKIDFQPYAASGALQGSAASRTVPANGQVAIFVSELFPSLANFKGKLKIKGQGTFAVLSLRQQISSAKLTTLPAFSSESSSTTFALPQIANGTGIKTRFILYNLGAAAGTATLRLTNDNGQPLSVRLSNGQTASQFALALPANGSLFLDTDGTGTVQAGAATIESTVPIGVSAIFSILSGSTLVTEAGIGDSPLLNEMTLPVDLTAGFNTGVALFNPEASPSVVTFALLDGQSGTQVAEVDYAIAPLTLLTKNHLAKFVTELAPGSGLSQGQLAITATGAISAISLRQGPGTLTTLPVVEGVAGGGGGPQPTTTKLLDAQEKNVAITSAKTVNKVLVEGFTITGQVTVPDDFILQGASAKSSTGTIYPGSVNFLNSNYRIVVPAGTYELAFCAVASGLAAAGPGISPAEEGFSALTVQKLVSGVVVNADVVRNATVDNPVIRTVSGSLTGLNKLPAGAEATIVFHAANATGYSSVDQAGLYTLGLPAGAYTSSVTFNTGEDTDEDGFVDEVFSSSGIYNVGTLTVAGSNLSGQNFPIPDIVEVTGMVSQPQTINYSDGTAIATDNSAVQQPDTGCLFGLEGFAFGNLDALGNYTMYLVKSRTYNVNGQVPITAIGTNKEGRLLAPNTNARTFAADAVLNIPLPAKPAEVVLSGRVTDGSGSPVNGVVVSVHNSAGLTGAANATFSAGTTTDAQGNYSLTVLSGTGYIIDFSPPVGFSSPFNTAGGSSCCGRPRQ